MISYKNILVAVELNSSIDKLILKRAQSLAEQQYGQLFLVHAVDNTIDLCGGVTSPGAYTILAEAQQEELLQKHRLAFSQVANSLGLPSSNQYLQLGNPTNVIKEVANTMHADLVVVGNRGRHGLALLFGSNAVSILHHVDCDILVIRVRCD